MQGILNVYSSKCGWCKNSQHIYPMQRLTYFVKGSITAQLTYCLVLCFAYAELTTDLLVWSDANQSNRRSAKQWHFPLWAKWVWSCLTQLGMIDRGLNVPFKAYFHAWMIVLLKVMLKTTTCDWMTSTSRYSILLLVCKKFYAANPEPIRIASKEWVWLGFAFLFDVCGTGTGKFYCPKHLPFHILNNT